MEAAIGARFARIVPAAVGIVLLAGAASAHAGAPLAQSNFNQDASGWKVLGDPQSTTPVHHASGGHPGGYISATDTQQGETMYWKAPPKFLGDQRDAYSGFLQFARRQSLNGEPDADSSRALILKGENHTAVNSLIGPTSTNWSTLSMGLTPAFGWENPDGSDISNRRFKRILGSLEAVKIQAEYDLGAETDSLDSVGLYPPAN